MALRTLAIISQKGGTGKTTLAVNLAVASERLGCSTALLDLDPQTSSSQWKDSRPSETPYVLSLHAARLSHHLDMMKENGCECVVIDTAPHSQKDALEVAQLADLILIPCKPSLIDLRAIRSSIQIAKLAQKPVLAVLTQTPPKGHLVEEASEAIRGYDIPLAPITVGSRMAFVHAFTVGKGVMETNPQSKAALEISTLWDFILQTMETENS